MYATRTSALFLRRKGVQSLQHLTGGRACGVRLFSKLPVVGDKVDITFKKDQPEVTILPDDEYPEWLWSIQQPTLKQLHKKMDENFEEVTMDELKRVLKLERRNAIRDSNKLGDEL